VDSKRDEWIQSADQLVQGAKDWCEKQGWNAKVEFRDLDDSFLGPYVASQLLFHTGKAQFLLTPVARYAPGAAGLFDLMRLPSYESARVSRSNGRWFIHPPAGEDGRRPWSESAFVDTVARLSERA
jgi:hypothetical protein